MGFDLVALDRLGRRKSGYRDCLHLGGGGMSEVLSAAKQTGLKDRRILCKFAFNDELVVTPRQCGTIARRLREWLALEKQSEDDDLVEAVEDFAEFRERGSERYGFMVE